MASYYLCPAVHHVWFVPGGNNPASGAQLFTYVAGSSTKTTVYKDDQGNSSHTNPIVLDSGGNLPSGSEVWIPTGVTIDVVFAPANDTDPPASPYFTLEDLSGINDISSAVSEWVTGPTPTFVSGTQLVLQGDQTSTFKNGRRIRSTNTGGTVYSRIASAIVASGSTTINVVSDSGSLDSGLSAVSYGLLDPQFTSITEYHVNKDGGSVASQGNGTTNIWGISGNSVHITGTNTISSFSSASYAGAIRHVIFDGSLSLQTSAAFLSAPCLGQNITTQAGDRASIVATTAAHAVITHYQRGNGGIVQGATAAQQETGTTTGFPVTPDVQHFHPSAGKFWLKADSSGNIQASYNVASIVDGGGGLLIVVYSVPFSSTNYAAVGTSHSPNANVQNVKVSTQTVSTTGWVCCSSGDTPTDPSFWHLLGMGDL